jgi:hypothetical protein
MEIHEITASLLTIAGNIVSLWFKRQALSQAAE